MLPILLCFTWNGFLLKKQLPPSLNRKKQTHKKRAVKQNPRGQPAGLFSKKNYIGTALLLKNNFV